MSGEIPSLEKMLSRLLQFPSTVSRRFTSCLYFYSRFRHNSTMWAIFRSFLFNSSFSMESSELSESSAYLFCSLSIAAVFILRKTGFLLILSIFGVYEFIDELLSFIGLFVLITRTEPLRTFFYLGCPFLFIFYRDSFINI